MNVQARASNQAATDQDILDAPPHMVAEIIRGALHLHPRRAKPHARASSTLGAKIGGPFDFDGDGPGGWWIVNEPELHLGEEIVAPDPAGWRRDQTRRFPRTAYTTVAPDWACEILSPQTRGTGVGPKRAIYREHGVGWLCTSTPTPAVWKSSSSVTSLGSRSER